MIEILLCKGGGFVSSGIKYFSRGRYCHAAILINGVVYQANSKNGVHKLSYEDFIKSNHYHRIEKYKLLKDIDENLVLEFLEKQLGKGYDYWAIIGFLFHTTKEGRKGLGRWICSEYVFAAIDEGGLKLLNINAWMVSPEMISHSTEIKMVESIKLK